MTGTVLSPLNELKDSSPDLYAIRQKHHEYQPHVLEESIPRLGCFWDDVLHFTALHPTKIAEALHTFGYTDIKLKYYEIDATKLDPAKTIVFLNKPREPHEHTKVTDFTPYDPQEVEKWAYIPEEAMNLHKKKLPTADEFLVNYGAPYILFKGDLSIEGEKIIEL